MFGHVTQITSRRSREDAKMASGLNRRSFDGLKLEDVTCGICLSILVEPVTMPCFHELCMPCFDQQVQKTSLHCPMCRVRIGSWARKAARENRLINQKRWALIREKFPTQVQRRLQGLDEESPEKVSAAKPHLDLAKPGEIRKEFEEQLRLYEEERKREQQLEEEESLKLIRLLQAQGEAQMVTVEGRRSRPTRAASRSAVNPEGSRWKRIVPLPRTPTTPTPVSSPEPMPSTSRASRSPSTDSDDSIAQELHHFKPILTAPKTPPKNPNTSAILTPQFVTASRRSLAQFFPDSDEDSTPINPIVTRTLAILESERWHRVSRVARGEEPASETPGTQTRKRKTPGEQVGTEQGAVVKKRSRGRPRKIILTPDTVPSVVSRNGKENERKVVEKRRKRSSAKRETPKRGEEDDKAHACKLKQYYDLPGFEGTQSPYHLRSRAK